jgi:hypothetical protein
MVHPLTSVFVAAAVFAGGAAAQIDKGKAPPAIPFLKTWNGAPASFDDFDGRVVILKFSETW